jgi:hypothetical protein
MSVDGQAMPDETGHAAVIEFCQKRRNVIEFWRD